MTTGRAEKPYAIVGQGTIFDGVAYWATLLGLLPHRDKGLLMIALAVALFTFACLAFGQTATKQFAGTASLYTYFGATSVILILVSLMPPNRPDRWLGGTRE
jgi:hypothetical protein